MTPVVLLLAVGATGVASYDLASFFSRKFVALGITGVDVHKVDRPVRAEMGGLAVLLSVSLGSAILMAFGGDRSLLFLSGVGTVSLVGLVGVADDKLELRQRDRRWVRVKQRCLRTKDLVDKLLPLLKRFFGLLRFL